jgi:hypothetical protein
MTRDVYPGSRFFHPGSRAQKRHWIPDTDPQQCFFLPFRLLYPRAVKNRYSTARLMLCMLYPRAFKNRNSNNQEYWGGRIITNFCVKYDPLTPVVCLGRIRGGQSGQGQLTTQAWIAVKVTVGRLKEFNRFAYANVLFFSECFS